MTMRLNHIVKRYIKHRQDEDTNTLYHYSPEAVQELLTYCELLETRKQQLAKKYFEALMDWLNTERRYVRERDWFKLRFRKQEVFTTPMLEEVPEQHREEFINATFDDFYKDKIAWGHLMMQVYFKRRFRNLCIKSWEQKKPNDHLFYGDSETSCFSSAVIWPGLDLAYTYTGYFSNLVVGKYDLLNRMITRLKAHADKGVSLGSTEQSIVAMLPQLMEFYDGYAYKPLHDFALDRYMDEPI